MATGRAMQLTRQVGEHLVAAELGRRGYVATPFAGNVPHFDLLACSQSGKAVPIQVKAINGPSWQFDAGKFLEIEIEKEVQRVLGLQPLPQPSLICVFVVVREAPGQDEFYIFALRDLQKHIHKTYKAGRRPKNPMSLHCAVWPKDLKQFKGNWKLVEKVLG
jgi:hypothetical protein